MRDCYRRPVPPLNCILACALSATHKNLKISRQSVSRESVESPSIPRVINYNPPLLPLAAASPPTLRDRDDLLTCAEKCKLHSGDDNFHEQTANTERSGADRGWNSTARPGYKPAISVFRTLDLASGTDSSPTNAVQSARDRSSITSTANHIETSSMRASCKDRPCTLVEI